VRQASGEQHRIKANFVFIGAGGGSLPLLQRSGIPEGKGDRRLSDWGKWLVCDSPEVAERHSAKVYGQALGAAPTMAVPHLDARILDGKKYLMFGPFASWTMKFLHESGSWLDLLRSVKPHNVAGLLHTGVSNLDLIRYLYQQGTQSQEERLAQLRDFYPSAKRKDWKLIDAGIRVQAIKNTEGKTGIVHYGGSCDEQRRHTLCTVRSLPWCVRFREPRVSSD
jgi:malate dehydrogenase (quinone)